MTPAKKRATAASPTDARTTGEAGWRRKGRDRDELREREGVLRKQSWNRLESRSAALSVRNWIRLPGAAAYGKKIAESHARPHGPPR